MSMQARCDQAPHGDLGRDEQRQQGGQGRAGQPSQLGRMPQRHERDRFGTALGRTWHPPEVDEEPEV